MLGCHLLWLEYLYSPLKLTWGLVPTVAVLWGGDWWVCGSCGSSLAELLRERHVLQNKPSPSISRTSLPAGS